MDITRAVTKLTAPDGDPTGFPEIVSSMAPQFYEFGNTTCIRSRPRQRRASVRIIDKMPENFRWVGLIHLALPHARFIHTFRDPAATCLSCFSKLFVGNLNYAYDLRELGRYYNAYAELMAHWHSALPLEIVLDVRYEALVTTFEAQARQIVAFCGLRHGTTLPRLLCDAAAGAHGECKAGATADLPRCDRALEAV